MAIAAQSATLFQRLSRTLGRLSLFKKHLWQRLRVVAYGCRVIVAYAGRRRLRIRSDALGPANILVRSGSTTKQRRWRLIRTVVRIQQNMHQLMGQAEDVSAEAGHREILSARVTAPIGNHRITGCGRDIGDGVDVKNIHRIGVRPLGAKPDKIIVDVYAASPSS